MAFGLFKKKGDDDFSDFGSDKSMGNASQQPDHLGLPLDGDITNTAPQSPPASGNPLTPSPSVDTPMPMSTHSPESFQELNEFTSHNAQDRASVPPAGDTPHKIAALEKDMQVIGAKMDAIKAVLESMNSRLRHIERIAESSQPKEEVVRW